MIESRDVLKMKYKQDWTLIAKGQVWLSGPIDCKSSEGREVGFLVQCELSSFPYSVKRGEILDL